MYIRENESCTLCRVITTKRCVSRGVATKVEMGFIHTKNIFGALTRLPDSDLGEYDEDVEVNVDLNGV